MIKYKIIFYILVFVLVIGCAKENGIKVSVIKHPPKSCRNAYYPDNRSPLTPRPLSELPLGSITPHGWLKKQLELEAEGYFGNLEDISMFLRKEDNAWLSREGKGIHGWEEVPYWIRGYVPLAYLLNDLEMISNAIKWIEPIIESRQSDGWFGPICNLDKIGGDPDLMPNMYVLYALEDYYDKTTDKRAIELMLGYCHYLKNLPKQKILSGGWQKYRGEGHLHHIYWLYNRTGQIWLLDLAKKIYSQAAPWTEENIKQGQSQFSHNVNIAEGMRQPATFWQQSHQKEHMEATYNIFNKLYKEYGLPGRSYIGCDFLDKPVQARKGLEACGMVEQILTGLKLLAITGDPIWADHAEQMAFNSLPAATSWDMKSLRYHTSPNIPVSDNTIKTPIFTWKGWMGISGTWMNPNAHRCCQHNIGMGWPNFVKHTWYATSDNGLAAGLLGPSKVNAKIANGKVVTIIENTRYPFREEVEFKLTCSESVNFPLYLRIPGWCENPELKLNGTTLKTKFKPGNFIRIYRKWQNNDKIILRLPMNLKIKRWESLGNAVSVEHGPLTYSLRIRARREKTTTYNWSEEALEFTKKHDLPVDHFAGTNEWPAYNLYPESPWNYALVSGKNNPTENLEVELKKWPDKDTPFKQEDVPVIIKVKGKRLFSWGLEDNNLTEPLPDSPVQTNEKIEQLVLIPMGAARLRITAFPVTGTN